MLGLLEWYELSGDTQALAAASGIADHLISQLKSKNVKIVKCGLYRGMASSSVLEPIMKLYNISGDKRYLDFATDIVTQWETQDGPRLVSRSDVPVALRFPHPQPKWFSYENGAKAYEMMYCYEGLLEYYKVTGNEADYKAVRQSVSHIIEEEINIAGSGSAVEWLVWWEISPDRSDLPHYGDLRRLHLDAALQQTSEILRRFPLCRPN